MYRLLFLILFLIPVAGISQSVLPLRADTIRMEKLGGSAELHLRNATRDTLGVLTNIGNGRTRFIRARIVGDTLFVGRDTLIIATDPTIQEVINNGNTISENDSINVDPSRSLTIHGGTGSSIILKALQSAVSHTRIVIQPATLGLEYRDLGTGNLKQFILSSANGINVNDGVNTTGMGYGANYRTNGIGNFGDRWIPDWGAVKDSAAGTIQRVLDKGDTTNRKIIFKDEEDTTVNHQLQIEYALPGNYDVPYTFGRGGLFTRGLSYTNGVNFSERPNVVFTMLGYNQPAGAGGRFFTDEAAFGFRAETHFETGGGKLFEFHLPEVTTESGFIYRPWSLYIDKIARTAQINSQITGLTLMKVSDGSDQDSVMLGIDGSMVKFGLFQNGQIEIKNLRTPANSVNIAIGDNGGSISATSSVGIPSMEIPNMLISSSAFQHIHQINMAAPNAFGTYYTGTASTFPRVEFITSDVSAPSGTLINNTNSHATGPAELELKAQAGDMYAFFRSVSNSNDFTIGYKASSNDFRLASSNGGYLGSGEIMTWKPSGRVGIGTTTPAVILDITDTGAIKIPVGTTAQRPTGALGMMRVITDSSNQIEYYNGTAWTLLSSGGGGGGGSSPWTLSGSDIYKNNSGNVGIGVTSPPQLLSVTKSSGGTIAGFGANGTNDLYTIGYNAGNGDIELTSSPFGGMNLITQSNNHIFLSPHGTGSVGVNTTPSAKFHVNGSFRVDLGSDAGGDMFYRSSNNFTRLGIGSSNYILTSSGTAPQWSSPATVVSNLGIALTSYTPTITSVTNVASTTLKGARYRSDGAYVEVWVYVTIDPTSVGSTEIAVSLPVASEIGANELFGSGSCGVAAQSGIVTTDATNNRATFIFSSTDTGAQDHVLIFTYPIVLP